MNTIIEYIHTAGGTPVSNAPFPILQLAARLEACCAVNEIRKETHVSLLLCIIPILKGLGHEIEFENCDKKYHSWSK